MNYTELQTEIILNCVVLNKSDELIFFEISNFDIYIDVSKVRYLKKYHQTVLGDRIALLEASHLKPL